MKVQYVQRLFGAKFRYWQQPIVLPYADATYFVRLLYFGSQRFWAIVFTAPFWLQIPVLLMLYWEFMPASSAWQITREWFRGGFASWLFYWVFLTAFGVYALKTLIIILFMRQTNDDKAMRVYFYLAGKYDAACLDRIRQRAENERNGMQLSSLAPSVFLALVLALFGDKITNIVVSSDVEAFSRWTFPSGMLSLYFLVVAFLICVRFAEQANVATVIVSAIISAPDFIAVKEGLRKLPLSKSQSSNNRIDDQQLLAELILSATPYPAKRSR